MMLQTSLIWVSYGVAIFLALFAAIVTTYTLSNPRDRSLLTTATTTLSLTVLLATVLLLPVDAALVSATTSTALGAKHQWATPERVEDILQVLSAVYYSLYGLDAALCLLVVPWVYFWYEEYDEIEVEEGGRSAVSRAFAAARYAAAVLVVVAIVLLVGFFVPAAGDRDGRHWDLDYYKQLLVANNGEKALTFALGLLLALGTLLYLSYTAAGLALLPVSLIKSAPSISAPQLSATTASALEQNRDRQRQLELLSSGRPDGPSQRDRRELDALQREEVTLVRRERLAAEALGEGRSGVYRFWLKICAVLRPVRMLGGLFLALVAVLVWVSVLITGIDKAKNSVCKQHCGYILGHIEVFQPVNWILVQSARVFPLDYVLAALLVLLLFASSVSGIATVGIRFLWVRIFRIRKGRTPPQALLMATVLLALAIFAIDYAVAMVVAPQYATYGTQTFCTRRPFRPGARPDCRGHPELVLPCSEALDYEHAIDVCTPTVMSSTLNRVSITWPFFGAVNFWGQFVFLAVFLVVFVTAIFRTPRLNLAEIDEEIEADEEENLLASTGRRLGATWEDLTGRTRQRSGAGYGATADGQDGSGRRGPSGDGAGGDREE